LALEGSIAPKDKAPHCGKGDSATLKYLDFKISVVLASQPQR